MDLETKWKHFTDEELLAIHLGLLQLSRNAQLTLWDMTPWHELRRRHDPLDPISLLSKYPILEKEMNDWLIRRQCGRSFLSR